MDSSTGTIASIIIDFIVVVQVERGWFFRLILIMIILILTKILIRLIDSSIKSGLGIRHQHCLFICRVSVKKDKFHKFMKILSKNLHTEHSTTSGQPPRSSSCIFLASHSLSQRLHFFQSWPDTAHFSLFLWRISWMWLYMLGHFHMWMCQISHQFSPKKPRCWFRYVF